MVRDEIVSLGDRRADVSSAPRPCSLRYGPVSPRGQAFVVHRRNLLVRRIIGGSFAFLVVTGTLLVLPVYAAPVPEADPIAPSMAAVDLGSVERPEDAAIVTADGAVVDAGPEADVAPPAPGQPGPSVSPSGADEIASSGAEIDGVPALTVSRPSTKRFSAVGVTWAQDDLVTGVTVQLRTKSDAGVWGAWSTVEQEDVEPTDGAPASSPGGEVRGGTAPVWTGKARGIEVIVQAADGSTPRDVQVELID